MHKYLYNVIQLGIAIDLNVFALSKHTSGVHEHKWRANYCERVIKTTG